MVNDRFYTLLRLSPKYVQHDSDSEYLELQFAIYCMSSTGTVLFMCDSVSAAQQHIYQEVKLALCQWVLPLGQ